MQILDVKVHTEPKLAPQASNLGENVGERTSRFDEALGSEQERRSIDDRGHKPAATIADNSKKQSSAHSKTEMAVDKGALNLLDSESEIEPINNWHDFLQSVHQPRDNEAPTMTTGHTVVATSRAKVTTPLTQAEAKEVAALLDQLGISLTAQEKQGLLDKGELSASLTTKVNQALASAGPNTQQTEPQQRLALLLPEQAPVAQPVPVANDEAPIMTTGHTVVATSGAKVTTPLTQAEAKEVVALLDQLGISLTAQEKQGLLDKGELSASLTTKVNQAFASAGPNTQQTEPQQRLASLLPEQAQAAEHTPTTSDTAPTMTTGHTVVATSGAKVTTPESSAIKSFTEQLPAAEQEQLSLALDALAEGNPAELKKWLAKQNLPNELMQPLMSLVDAAESAIAALTSTELQNDVQGNMKAGLAEVLAAAVTLVKTEKEAGREPIVGQEGENKLLQTLQQLTQRVSTSEGAPTSTLVLQQLTQPQENKVLLAFSSTAQELRALVQESLRDDSQLRGDSRELQFMRGVEQQLSGQSQVEGPKNINPNFLAAAQQAQLQQPTVAQQAARAMTAPSQLAETAFEQARQNQQYIDITGLQGTTQLKDQVALMFNNRSQVAEMRLDPPELGRLNIRLQMTGEQQASVTFLVNTPQAREAIEQAMPRLREMLEEQGIQLTDSNVRDESSQLARESQQQGKGGQGGGGLSGNDESQQHEEATYITKVDVPKGQIDYYV
ncbi:flagellar hook-length control protein FliK [Aliidiomarina quisquiliarum]|uniref:flagellar hook-length control protein FliK n=1 Tax=Aliidiomarina quisquiliarum TaxID=2938947 RepID=UPI00208E80BA|nr:flagellar hook-length control protein FliK [Aliidiomarina quisquiliarum]MCO4322088.1 flagellar hook-length control protein FliK [Aliidiomarina quisquiliarum]